jgi:N-acetylglutamate synthase-like GNAT family acetyltransferase
MEAPMTVQQTSITVTLNNGARVAIRPLTPADVELERDFIMGLSPQSRRFRFLDTIAAPSAQLLRQLTTLDPDKEAAYIALTTEHGIEKEIGVARCCATGDGKAEFAVAVSNDWLRRGLGTALTNCIIEAARARALHTLFSIDSSDNLAMQNFAAHFGFEHAPNPDDSTEVVHTLRLHPRKPDTQQPRAADGHHSA